MKKSFILLIGFVFGLFSLNVFSAVSTQTGSGANWGGVPNSAKFLEPPHKKRVYIDHAVTASITAKCVSATRVRQRFPLDARSTHMVVGIPVKDARNVNKHLIFEFPASLLGGVTDAKYDGETRIYEATDFTDNYRDTATPLPDRNYKTSQDGVIISIRFVPTSALKPDPSRGIVFKQSGPGSVTPLNVWMDLNELGSGSVRYIPHSDPVQKSGVVTIGLSVPVAVRMYGCAGQRPPPPPPRRSPPKAPPGRGDGGDGRGGGDGDGGGGDGAEPLMVFFDNKRPEFTGLSTFPFPLVKEEDYVTWPEQNSPGYFVTLDQNKDGKITEAYELFGDTGLGKARYANGFESLKVFDSNKDKKINKKDKVFSRLVLWKDLNGNGIGEKEEQIPLSQKIESISLNYKEIVVMFEDKARALQESTFVFVDVEGKKKEGYAADLWFNPIAKSLVNVISKNKKAKKEVLTAEIESVKEVQKKYSLMSKIKKWFSIR